ncbi:MAG: hypothetical protein P8Y63_05855, partial [Deltaproteobacteria bacterium]
TLSKSASCNCSAISAPRKKIEVCLGKTNPTGNLFINNHHQVNDKGEEDTTSAFLRQNLRRIEKFPE